jgi:hypothetical protein
LLAHGRWFSPGTPASSTTKTGRHDIAESGIKHNKSNQILMYSIGSKGSYLAIILQLDSNFNKFFSFLCKGTFLDDFNSNRPVVQVSISDTFFFNFQQINIHLW